MRLAGAMGIGAALIVSAAFWHWSGEANREFCAMQMEAAKAPIREPLSSASNAQIIYGISKQLPACDASLSSDQIANGALGGTLIGFIAYVCALIFGKFRRWVQR